MGRRTSNRGGPAHARMPAGRVRGRSPLEYLDDGERDRQALVVVALMHDPPATVPALAEQFAAGIAELE